MIRNATLFILLTVSTVGFAQITSTFDSNTDGWTFFDPAAVTVNHVATGGNPNGYATAGYTSNISANQFWRAPSKFLGNQMARSLGMNLRFDMQVAVTGTNSFTQGDVVISNTSVGISLVYSLLSKPGTAWTSYSLRLDETLGWRIGNTSGALATRAQIISVLSNITDITLRGTYVNFSPNSSSIDNVVLEQRIFAPPVISSISPLAALPGTPVTISGSNFGSNIANNSVYFGNARSIIMGASANSITVTVPTNAQFGKITVVNKTSGLAKQSEQYFNPLFDGGGRIIPSSFKSNFTFDVTGGVGGLSLADIDGDGWTDIGVAARDNSAIRVYRNLGLGGALSTSSFAAPVSFATTLSFTNGSGLSTVDFDNDGKLDMATSGWTGSPGAFATFRNISTPGNLAFEPVERWNGLTDESPVNATADIDGDGLIDLTSGEGSSPGATWIIQNISTPGNIEFGVSQSFFGNNSNQGTTLGDLNGDGKPEFIHKIQNTLNQQDIYTNTSTPGSISFGTSFTLPSNIFGNVIVFDFNKDGKNDLAWKDGFSNNDIRVRINTNTGGPLSATDFATEVIFDSETSNFGGASLGDINGDGKADILATDSDTPAVFESAFSGGAFDANAFVPAHRFPGVGAFTYPIAPQAADLNGDGKPDMVVGFTNSSPNKIAIYENQNVASPKISVTTVSPLAAPIGSTVTITGSGFSPNTAENFVYFGAVQAASVLTASSTSLTVLVPIGASYAPVSVRVGELSSTYHLPFKTTFSPGVTFNNTHFAPPISSALANAMYHIDVADIDTDGKPDIAAEINTQRPIFFRNTHLLGNITTSSLTNAGTTAAAATDAKFLDVDGNGLPELVGMQGQFFQNNSTPGSISFGTGATGGPFYTGTGSAFADFNLDGKMDFAAIETNRLVVLENRSLTGTISSVGAFGSFANSVSFAKPSFDGGLVAADFDADGYADVIALTPSTNNYSVFRNNKAPRINSSSFAVRVDVATGTNPSKIYTGDFDSDGKLDFVVHYGTGANAATVSVFHNQSTPGSIIFNRVDLANPDPQPVTRLTVADLDGDGKPEIVTTHETANRFSIFKNVHTSGLLTTASFASPFNTTVTAPRGINTVDVNGDSKLEIVLTQNAAGGQLLVYQNLIANPTITSFLPTTGPIGTQVVITGTNFSTLASDNTVQFNGINTYVVSSTATSITAIVPPGTTTGPISVTVTNNTATSTASFAVTPFTCPPAATLGGTLDVAFNPDIQSTITFTAVELQSTGKSLVSAPDVLIGGFLQRGLLRFNADGTRDGTFAINNYSSDAKQLIVQPDDKIILFDNDEFASIKRLNADGTNDAAFAGPVFDNSGTYATVVGPLELQSDGKVLYSASNTFDGIDELVRLNVNGSRDFSFVAPSDLDALVIRQQTDGKIVVGGGFGIIRLDASGNVDASFISSTMDGAVNDLIIQPDGKIIIIGTFTNVSGVPTRNIARLLADGNVDLTFNSGNGFSQYLGAQPNVVKLLSSGKFLVAGEFTSYDDVLRNRLVILNTDGSLDCTFDPLGGASNELLDVAVQTDNKILIVGSLTSYDGTSRNSFARVNNSLASLGPKITSFAPTSGPIGTTVIITGTNFNTTPANNIVYFGATRATVTAATATQLTVTVPVGATYQPISVLVDGLVAYSAIPFVVSFASGAIIDACAFAPKVDFATGTNPLGMALADFDGDGKVDVAITNRTTQTLAFYRNTSTTGTIDNNSLGSPLSLATLNDPFSATAVDINGDGKLDIAVTNAQSATLSLYRNTSIMGTISFDNKVDFVAGNNPLRSAFGDLDDDGKPELVIANRFSNSLAVYKNISSSGPFSATTFASPVTFTTGSEPYNVTVGDLNGDSKPDLIALNHLSNTISVYQNVSTAGTINASSFATSVTFATGVNPNGIELADIDGDDQLDMVVTNLGGNSVSILRNLSLTNISPGSFSPKVDFTTGSGPYLMAIADYDGDAKLDIAVSNSVSNTISILRNTSTAGTITSTSLATKVDFTSGTFPLGISTADIDGDGKSEIITGNQNSNSLSIFRNVVGSISPPTITSFAPTSGPVGTSVTITGTDFITPFNNLVRINGIPAAITAYTSTTLTVTIPPGATSGPLELIVGCSVLFSASNFTVSNLLPPTIISFTSTSGPIGTTVIITGTNFSTTPSNNIVTFNGVPAVVISSTATTLTVIVPSGATTGRISVSVVGNNNVATSADDFIVTSEIIVYNALSPNTDEENSYFRIDNLETVEPNNTVIIYNRWGTNVFEVDNYSEANAFRGLNKNGNELPSGTYFYKIVLKSSGTARTGYLVLKR